MASWPEETPLAGRLTGWQADKEADELEAQRMKDKEAVQRCNSGGAACKSAKVKAAMPLVDRLNSWPVGQRRHH